jgi:hypothetical protein
MIGLLGVVKSRGDGVRLHGGPGLGRVDLERTAVSQSGQLTDLRFRVAK